MLKDCTFYYLENFEFEFFLEFFLGYFHGKKFCVKKFRVKKFVLNICSRKIYIYQILIKVGFYEQNYDFRPNAFQPKSLLFEQISKIQILTENPNFYRKSKF